MGPGRAGWASLVETCRSFRSRRSTGLPSHSPHLSTLSSLLVFCSWPGVLQQIHSRFIIHGLQQNHALSSDLITRYASIGRLDLSIKLLDTIDFPDAHLYTTILRSVGEPKEALSVYRQMLARSINPVEETYPSILGALLTPRTGAQIHCHLNKLGFETYALVGAALVEMYTRHGDTGNARRVFGRLPARNLASWNAFISGVVEYGDPSWECFGLFGRMRSEGLEPDSITMLSLLRACVDLSSLAGGRFVHLLIIVNNLSGDPSVSTALLTMYCRLGSLCLARLLFDRMEGRECAVWNVMMSGYSRNRNPEQALALLVEMVRSGVRTDLFTAIASLASVSQLRSLSHGKQIHGHVIRNATDSQASVRNSLIEMYSNCSRPEMGRKIFDSFLTNKTVVSWSCMIKGYLSNDCPSEALSLFGGMRRYGAKPDPVTLINVLPACVGLGALEQLRNIHGYSLKQGLNSTLSVTTALLVSYAKCGCIETAHRLFDHVRFNSRGDVVLWNAMIGAYSRHGNWGRSFQLYNQMKESGVTPDGVTFVGLLTACVNSGRVKEGWECLSQMVGVHGLRLEQEHYGCIVDLLGRSGHLGEAKCIIERMPFKPDARVWGPLLSACKLHSKARLAEFATERLIQMEPQNAANYVLLSNIYAAAGRWDGVAKMRSFLRGRGLRKTPGCSWLEVNGQVHKFLATDQSHPRSGDIYTMLWTMELEIKDDTQLLDLSSAQRLSTTQTATC